ncbi:MULTISPECIES: DUF3489 domain-containing protein [Sphingobium]|uniref:DUF3489 domain-containing protein n=1 Tax=Sphingobium TaxID=165695 RepID=UPI0015EBA877|nr:MULTISPECIES: DUF3489 domain-containing protein [Sphingobium]MCW2362984.1 hypothetical protein [Sphingobium sp. B10D3B]MCW2400336.1 hypothetical protein [Sphingobium sp. B10D7B]MCW2407314.1 hypothetical protein [Sphingobium xanthum]
MTKLNDLQLVLLSAAAQRDDGSLLPPPDHLADQAGRIRKVIPPLIRRGLIEEAATTDLPKVWREEGDDRFALVITQAGRAAIGVDSEQDAQAETVPIAAVVTPPNRTRSKTEQVLDILGREQGASLDELVGMTGWLPHSTRAALTGMRKKGHVITLDKSGERACYRLVESAAA